MGGVAVLYCMLTMPSGSTGMSTVNNLIMLSVWTKQVIPRIELEFVSAKSTAAEIYSWWQFDKLPFTVVQVSNPSETNDE